MPMLKITAGPFTFRARLERTRDEELATGIDEFLAIARDRLTRG